MKTKVSITILELRKQRHHKVKWHSQGHCQLIADVCLGWWDLDWLWVRGPVEGPLVGESEVVSWANFSTLSLQSQVSRLLLLKSNCVFKTIEGLQKYNCLCPTPGYAYLISWEHTVGWGGGAVVEFRIKKKFLRWFYGVIRFRFRNTDLDHWVQLSFPMFTIKSWTRWQ